MDLTAYLIIYFGINFIYRFVLEDVQKRYEFFSNNFHELINSINKTIYLSSKSRDFEKAAMFCENNSSLIPLTFVLAFYVSHVVSRWWAQWNAIPWPDGLAFKINSYCSGLVCLIEEKKLIISSLLICITRYFLVRRKKPELKKYLAIFFSHWTSL